VQEYYLKLLVTSCDIFGLGIFPWHLFGLGNYSCSIRNTVFFYTCFFAVMLATTGAEGPGLTGTGNTSTAIAKYSSLVMIMPSCPWRPPPSYDATLIAFVLSSRRMTFRSSNVGSPVTFGREECGNSAIRCRCRHFWLVRRANVAPCYDEY
jgi:hypothetical protein